MHLRFPVFTVIAVGFFWFVIKVTWIFLCDKMSFPVKTFFSKVKMKVAQLCLTLCDPMDYTVHRILQARILKWVAVPFSKGSSQPWVWTLGLLHCRHILYRLGHQRSPRIQEWAAYSLLQGIFLTQECNRGLLFFWTTTDYLHALNLVLW